MQIKSIRQKIRKGRFDYSAHALEEMDEDDLDEADLCNAILNGVVSAELTDDPRGIRFVVRGLAGDAVREVEVVCRFLPSGLLRKITVYELKG